MNINDFVRKDDFVLINEGVNERKEFRHTGVYKKGNKQITMRIHGKTIDDDLARDIWNGNNYLVHFDADISGGGEYMGFGFATDKLWNFDSWDDFKEFVNKQMTYFKGYEVEEYGQLCMF